VSGINPERRAKAFEMFAGGATERQVAVALGCGNATAHRLRQAFLDQQDPAQAAPEAITPAAPDFAARLAELEELRDRIAGVVTTHEDRAQASRTAVAALEAERLDMLAREVDAQPLRQRRRDAEDDLADPQDPQCRSGRGRSCLTSAEDLRGRARTSPRHLRPRGILR
jgi:hypothetical protein